MNSKERVRRAMRRDPAQLPDRVPVMCQLTLGHYFLNMRDTWQPYEIWFTSDAFADALITLARRYRFDGILVNLPGRDPAWLAQIALITDTGEGQQITLADGTPIFVPWDDNALYAPGDSAWNPYPDYTTFDPDRDMARLDEWPRYTWGVYHVPTLSSKAPGLLLDPPEYFYHTLDRVLATVGDRLSVHGEVFSPFTHFMELFGYENALLGMALDPGKAAAILDQFTRTTIAWGSAQAARGVDAVLISSAFAGGGFISPKMYAQFVVPYERKVVDALHAAYPDLPVYTHTCGKLGDRLELLIDSHTDGVDTLDPPPLGNTTLADAKAQIAGRMFIKGNMNSVAILTDTEDQFVARATSALHTGQPGGGYILSTACSVAPHVAPAKLEKLADLADEHGRYT